MDTRPVFVLLTAETCGSCKHFKNSTWNSIKKELEKRNRVRIVEINVPSTGSKPDSSKYHPELSRWIGWFPTIILFPSDRWDNHNSVLTGIIKNGEIKRPNTVKDKNGDWMPEHVSFVGKMNLSKGDVLKWVDFTLDKVPIFANSSIYSNSQSNKETKYQRPETIKVPTAAYYKFKHSKVN